LGALGQNFMWFFCDGKCVGKTLFKFSEALAFSSSVFCQFIFRRVGLFG